MTNNDFFQRLYSQKLNQNENYQSILREIDCRQSKPMMLKRLTAAIGIMLLIIGVVVLYQSSSPDVTQNSTVIHINEITQATATKKINARQIELSYDSNRCLIENQLDSTDAYKNAICVSFPPLQLPNDLANQEKIYAVYAQSDSNKAEDHRLLQYERAYTATDSQRSVLIQYAEDHQPVRDYGYENGKASWIDQQEVLIYHYENSYSAQLRINNYNIVIETNDIAESELIRLIQSVITAHRI